ncbi:MAG: hypothetical protein ACRCX7_09980 [Cetobacterium sp.]|uniref:hypothetical protein n=1 Tax=Cetobacterium sp. TaxID=2071632 RepID=UPI003F3CD606
MKVMEFWLLRNKATGKYVFLETYFAFGGTGVALREEDDIHLMTLRRDSYCWGLDIAERRKAQIEESYNLDLEIVKFEQHTEYKEV